MPLYSIRKITEHDMLVPETILEVLGLKKGEYLIFKGSKTSREIVIRPLMTPSSKAAELKVLLRNVPGTNARVDAVLGNLGINIVFGKGGLVEETVYSSVKVLDLSDCTCTLREVKKELESIPEVIDVAIEEL
ncbi:MAG: hypothetical protein KO463_07305 [Candidatus Methanofastidiosa archaeon]|jgi:hypothetical protein|nr:hypothetical protein [Candidatus Methanofastidiosa archaeon]